MKKLYLIVIPLLISVGLLLVWLAMDEPLDPEAAAWLEEVGSYQMSRQNPSDDQLYLIGVHSISGDPIGLGQSIVEYPNAEQSDALDTPDRNELISLLDCRDPAEKRCQAIPRLLYAQQALLDNYKDWKPREMPIFYPYLLHGAELWSTAELLSMLEFLWNSIADTGRRPCEECQYESLALIAGFFQTIENNIDIAVLTVLLNQRLDFILELSSEGMMSLHIERLQNLARPLKEHGLDPRATVKRGYSSEASIVRMFSQYRTGFVEGFGIFWYLDRVLKKPNASANYLHKDYSEHLSWIDPVQYVRHADPDQLPADDQKLPLRNRDLVQYTGPRPAPLLGSTLGLHHDQNARLILLSHQLRGLQGDLDWQEEAATDNPFGEGFGLFTDESRSRICYEGPRWTQQDVRCIPRIE